MAALQKSMWKHKACLGCWYEAGLGWFSVGLGFTGLAWSSYKADLHGGSWDFVATSNWAHNPTCYPLSGAV